MSSNLEATVAWGIFVEKTGLYYFSDGDDEEYTKFILARTGPQIDLFDFLDSNTNGKGKYPLLEFGFIGRLDYGIESYAIFVADSSLVVSEWASRFNPNALSVSEEGLVQLAAIHKELNLDDRDRGGWKIWTLLG